MNAIDYFSYGHPLIKIRSYFAVQARKKIYNLFIQKLQPDNTSTVIDLGVTPDQLLPESNLFEALYPYKENLTAVTIEDAGFLEQKYTGLKFIQIGIEESLPFKDNQFDILFCSAVIEHVGDTAAQQAFMNEIIRISKAFFLTTPHRYFPIEMHTLLPLLHWLPQSYHQRILKFIGLDFWSKTENLNLLTPSSLARLLPNHIPFTITSYKLFGFPSNIIIYSHQSE